MKLKLVIVLIFFAANLFGIEIDTLSLKSKIKNVTVFFDGAQITREAKIDIIKGKHLLVISGLPAEINPQSIQVENKQKITILSVKHEIVMPDAKNQTVKAYEEKIKELEIKIKEINNKISVCDIEEKILLDNSHINTNGKGASLIEIKELSVFYRTRLNEIKQDKLKFSLEIFKIKEKIQELYKELNERVSVENKTYSKILVLIDCEYALIVNFNISYFVASAGWSPIYDFRVNEISEPLNLVYNANIFQSTGEDWKNVHITLSTNTPSVSIEKPELETWFINRRNRQFQKPVVNGQSSLKGHITDKKSGEAIPFANIMVSKNGKTVGAAVSDFDGNYLIKPINPGMYDITVSVIGYIVGEMKNVTFNANQIIFKDFALSVSTQMLEEVQVMSYDGTNMMEKADYSSGTVSSYEISRMAGRSAESVASTVGGIRGSRESEPNYYIDGAKIKGSEFIIEEGYEAAQNISSLEYNIDIPYSIPSDGSDYMVKIKEVKLPVNYHYVAVPKLDKDAFLVAEVVDWTRLNLLSGESSIYYKGTFTGQSEIDANCSSDTLSISLNRDKNIVIERILLKEKNEKKLVGNNIKQTNSWSISVRNNKSVKTKIFIEEQFPISEDKSVEIERLEYSNGKLNEKTGKVTWELELQPNEKKELLLVYSVKYPQWMNLNLK